METSEGTRLIAILWLQAVGPFTPLLSTIFSMLSTTSIYHPP
jgi:hypothetical protein